MLKIKCAERPPKQTLPNQSGPRIQPGLDRRFLFLLWIDKKLTKGANSELTEFLSVLLPQRKEAYRTNIAEI